MKRTEAIETLVTAFGALMADQKSNLLYHAEKGTKVLCGEDAYKYQHLGGG